MKKLFVYLKGLKKECILGPFLKLCEAALELFVPYVIMNILKVGVPNNDAAYIVKMSLLLVAMGFFGLVFSVAAQYFCSVAACTFSSRIRKALFDKITSLPQSRVDELGKSTLISRITSDVDQVQTGLNLALRLLLRAPIIVFGALILSFTVNARAAVIFCILIPVLLVIVFSVMLTGAPIQRKTRQILDRLTLSTRENLNGIRVIRAFNLSETEKEKFDGISREQKQAQIKTSIIFSLMNPLTYVSVNLCIVALVYKGGLLCGDGLMECAEIIALYNYMSQILAELIKMANLIITVTKAKISGDRISAIIDDKSEQTVISSEAENSNNSIEFKNVSFSYHSSSDKVLKNLTFEIKKGEKIGIIGGTGSGKTSIINLLSRMYDADDGEIFIDGKNVLSNNPDVLRRQIGIVPQKADLFRGTVKSNMLYGNENASDEEIKKALEIACADGFVDEMESGIDSVIEQNGRNLSGGQKQRLAIARILLRRPNIIIFDDSTSAIDYLTEKKIRENITNGSKDITVITVSQRISSVSECDRIIVIDDGCCERIGTHSELLENCESYREIYETQIKGGLTDGN